MSEALGPLFEPLGRLGLGLLTGIAFGFLLQKGRVAKHRVIVGQFLLRDWTVVRVMATAVIVGGVGVYALHAQGLVDLHVKAAGLGRVAVVAALFGAGMALLGYCPGTSMAAWGEGRRDAAVGVLGMLFGAGLFVVAQPLASALGRVANLGLGEVTLPELAGSEPWPWLAGLIVLGVLLMTVLQRRRRDLERLGRVGQASAESAGQRPADPVLRDPLADGGR